MTTIYKLTDSNMTTRGGYQWALGDWHEVAGEGLLCTAGWLHTYDDPLVAVLLAPIHVRYDTLRLFRGTGGGRSLSDGTKTGWQRVRLDEEMELPVVTPEQRVAFGILCALRMDEGTGVVTWATGWLCGHDRSAEAAYRAWCESAVDARRHAPSAAECLARGWGATASLRSSVAWAACGAVEAACNRVDLPALAHQAMQY